MIIIRVDGETCKIKEVYSSYEEAKEKSGILVVNLQRLIEHIDIRPGVKLSKLKRDHWIKLEDTRYVNGKRIVSSSLLFEEIAIIEARSLKIKRCMSLTFNQWFERFEENVVMRDVQEVINAPVPLSKKKLKKLKHNAKNINA